MPIHGYPVGLGVLTIALGIAARMIHPKSGWLHRVSIAAFIIGLFLLALGVVPLQDALATATAGGAGGIALLVIALFAAGITYYEMHHKHKDRRIRALVAASVTGVALLALIGDSARLFAEAARSPRKTATALAQSVRSISSGRAAHSMTSHDAGVILILALAAALALIFLVHKFSPKAKSSAAGPRAITSGRPALPPPGRR